MQNYDMFYNKGWECPKCGAVMSPSTPYCRNCAGITQTTTSSSSGQYYDVDWAKSISSLQTNEINKMKFEKEYRVNEVAEILGVCNRTVFNWIKGGKLKAYRRAGGGSGAPYFIKESELEHFMNVGDAEEHSENI